MVFVSYSSMGYYISQLHHNDTLDTSHSRFSWVLLSGG